MIAFGDEAIERSRHRFNRLRMNVVLQDDRSRTRPIEDALENRKDPWPFPILGVHRPVDDIEFEVLGNPRVFRLVESAVRGAQQNLA